LAAKVQKKPQIAQIIKIIYNFSAETALYAVIFRIFAAKSTIVHCELDER
jgi:hypothetical protein